MTKESSGDPSVTPGWMRAVLLAAAVYNAIWGAATILFPNALFDWTGMARPLYPQIWQCVGMIVGVYGVAYAAAATHPIRHWPVVLAGLLGKIAGPIGFAAAVADGVFPAAWGWTIVTNDLIWWVPFALILRAAYRSGSADTVDDVPPLPSALDGAVTQSGVSVAELSDASPVMLVFLRHFGCTFCREALADVARNREAFEARGTRVVLVHMGEDEEAVRTFRAFGLEDLDRVSDPDRLLYRSIGLGRGTFRQLFGLRVIWRGVRAAILEGHGFGLPTADPRQMPGVFLIQNRRILRAFRHVHAGERPDYAALSVCEATNERMQQELNQAAEVQKSLLPKRLPEIEGGRFAWELKPTDALAGDTLNVLRLDDDHVGMYVLDVSGHGVSSALLSVTLHHWLSPERNQSGLFTRGTGDRYRIVSPAEVARKLNRQFPMDTDTAQYFTLVYGILNTKSFEFTYVTAGHPAPLLQPHGAGPRQLPGTGIPIGLMEDATYKEETLRLNRGDRLYLFSDGLVEAGNREGEEYGVDRLLSGVDASRGLPLSASVREMVGSVQQWRNGAPFPDDISLLSFEVTPSPADGTDTHTDGGALERLPEALASVPRQIQQVTT